MGKNHRGSSGRKRTVTGQNVEDKVHLKGVLKYTYCANAAWHMV